MDSPSSPIRRFAAHHRPRPIARARAKLPTPRQVVSTGVEELDDRVGIAGPGRSVLDHIFPDHWSFMLGELAMYSFLILVATGIFLTLYFVPSASEIVYHGAYRPLDGQRVSEAYASTLNLSFGVRAGLLVRQIHHWAADIFIGSIIVHLMRIYFTSAYRKPRDINWPVGVTMLLLAIMNGYLGYSLPGDLLSGTGVRIGYGIVLSIPIIGSYLAFFIFGGPYPKSIYVPRFFIAHVLIVPLLILGLLGAHLYLVMHQKHTQWPGEYRKQDNVVGQPLWPYFAAKSSGLMLMVAGVLCLMGVALQIDPIWQYGPYVASHASDASQPDWYQLWLEGALRLMPNAEISGLGHTFVVAVFVPGVLLPGLTFLGLYALPLVERKLTGHTRPLQLLIAPRRRAVHTAFGVGVFTFYFVLTFAGSDDVLANFFSVSLSAMVWVLRITLLVLPILTAAVAYACCRELGGRSLRRTLRQTATIGLGDSRFFEVRSGPPTAPLSHPEPLGVPDEIVQFNEATQPRA
jgi:ubiquinol-cytochrome c reductase cytochrome b subunit